MTGETELSSLLERVRGAKGADREIDADIWWYVASPIRPEQRPADVGQAAPFYSASLDAAIALVERIRPGCRYVLSGGDSGWSATLQWTDEAGRVRGTATGDDDYDSGSIALLAALLASLNSEVSDG